MLKDDVHIQEQEFSTLSCSSTHNITLQVLQRRTLGPTPPNASPGRSLSWLVKGTSIKSGGIGVSILPLCLWYSYCRLELFRRCGSFTFYSTYSYVGYCANLLPPLPIYISLILYRIHLLDICSKKNWQNVII
jgi:hypothetical protein